MKTVYVGLTVCAVLVFSWVAEVWSLDIKIATTEARTSSNNEIHVNFVTELVNTGSIDPSQVHMAVDWQTVGGIVPCVKVAISKGCFVDNQGFHIPNSDECGVRLTYDPNGRGAIDLTLRDFVAHFVPNLRYGVSELRIDMTFQDDSQSPLILGILGGTQVQMEIEEESAIALLSSIESVVRPSDFP